LSGCAAVFVFLSWPTFGFLLKLFSGLAAAGFGILGIGTKTRLDSGKLTKEGKVALVGILVAGAIGSIATINDFVSSANSLALLILNAEVGRLAYGGASASDQRG
jgi:hypothetical protein